MRAMTIYWKIGSVGVVALVLVIVINNSKNFIGDAIWTRTQEVRISDSDSFACVSKAVAEVPGMSLADPIEKESPSLYLRLPSSAFAEISEKRPSAYVQHEGGLIRIVFYGKGTVEPPVLRRSIDLTIGSLRDSLQRNCANPSG